MEGNTAIKQDIPMLAHFHDRFKTEIARQQEQIGIITKMCDKIKTVVHSPSNSAEEPREQPRCFTESIWEQMDIMERNNQRLDVIIIDHLSGLVGL